MRTRAGQVSRSEVVALECYRRLAESQLRWDSRPQQINAESHLILDTKDMATRPPAGESSDPLAKWIGCAHREPTLNRVTTPVAPPKSQNDGEQPLKAYYKSALILASLVVGNIAFSGPHPPPPPPNYNPQVAYAVSSQGANTTTIEVSNADGSNVASLYSTRNITSGMKFAPTDNRIVFVEQNAIKVLTYAVSSRGVTTTSVNTLTNEPFQPLKVDVSPDGTQLLFTEKTATTDQYAIYVMSMSGGPKTLVSASTNLYMDAVWAHSNSRIGVIEGVGFDGALQTINVFDLDVNYKIINETTIFTSTVSQLYQLSRLESAHTSDTLLFAASPSGSNFSVHQVDMGTFAVTGIVAGGNASFNADDSMILFIGPTVANLYTFDLSTSTQTQLTSKVLLSRPDFLP